MLKFTNSRETIFDWFLNPQIHEISHNITIASTIISAIIYTIYYFLRHWNKIKLSHFIKNIGIIIALPFVLNSLFFIVESIPSSLSEKSINKSISITLQKDGILSNAIQQNLIPETLNDLSQKQIGAAEFLYNSFNLFVYGRLSIALFIHLLINLFIIISPIIILKPLMSRERIISFESFSIFFSLCITKILMLIIDLLLFSFHFEQFIQFIEHQNNSWKYSINQNLCVGVFFITYFIAYISTFWFGKKILELRNFDIYIHRTKND